MSEEKKQHVAVALHYEYPGTPKVVAKGSGAIAEAIIKLAQEHQVAVEKNAELAAALSAVELDENIPIELFKAVAQVIGFVLKASKAVNAKHKM
jgi:flagellar biosynthesis protein